MTRSPPQSHFFQIEGGPHIHYTQTGNIYGPLLICLHGLGGSVATFFPLLSHLPSKRYNVICIDFEGFGKTALSSTTLSIQGYVDTLSLLISHLRSTMACHDPIVIIGHGLGSIVALHYAAKYRSSIAGLGLIAVGRSASHIQIAQQRMLRIAERVGKEGIDYAATLAMSSNFAPGEEDRDGRRDVVRDQVAASDPKAYAMVCEAMVSAEHIDPDYAKILCPALFISGRGDVISPPGRARDMECLMGGKVVVDIVRGGHQPILSDLDGTKDAMAELFRLIELSRGDDATFPDTMVGATW